MVPSHSGDTQKDENEGLADAAPHLQEVLDGSVGFMGDVGLHVRAHNHPSSNKSTKAGRNSVQEVTEVSGLVSLSSFHHHSNVRSRVEGKEGTSAFRGRLHIWYKSSQVNSTAHPVKSVHDAGPRKTLRHWIVSTGLAGLPSPQKKVSFTVSTNGGEGKEQKITITSFSYGIAVREPN